MKEYIKFDVAKQAWKSGFDVPQFNAFDPEGKEYNSVGDVDCVRYGSTSNTILRPLQSELQTWLRDIYNIVVLVDINVDSEINYHMFVYKDGYEYSSLFNGNGEQWDTWEKALEEGLLQGLKLI